MKALFSLFTACLVGCAATHVYLPSSPAPIECTGRTSAEILREVAADYSVGIVFMPGADTTTRSIFGKGVLPIAGTPLLKLLYKMEDDHFHYDFVRNRIVVCRALSPFDGMMLGSQTLWRH